uniref:Uncharacterized protein n=1 Tax=Amphimedon queenslandica TaxID=400682 RepID=A0A1X7TBX9_AMPQE
MADNEESAHKENQNPSKKRRLSLTLKRKSKQDRFVEASSEDLQSIYCMPGNSARSSRWALNDLRSWFDEYNKRKKATSVVTRS